MRPKKIYLTAVVLLLVFCFVSPTFGLKFDLNTALEGQPLGTTPWLTAEIVQGDGDKIVNMNLATQGLTDNVDQYIISWYFNLNPIVNLSIYVTIPIKNFELVRGSDSLGSGPATGFDLGFSFSSDDKFFAGQTLFLTIVSDTAITPELFNATNSGGNFLSSSLIQVPGSTSWIAAVKGAEPNPSPVPEPATMLLLGAGIAGIAALGRKKFLN